MLYSLLKMAQYLKDDVRDRIAAAALEVFAREGFARATIGAVARRAGISTGNIYRYFPDKEALFLAVEPPSFATELLGLLRRRVRSLDGVASPARLPPGSAFRAVSEALMAHAISHRLRVVILLGRAEGTRYEPFAGRLVVEMRNLAIGHYRRLGRPIRVTPALRFALDCIYWSWIRTMVGILDASSDEAAIRERVETYSRFHLGGLNALFA